VRRRNRLFLPKNLTENIDDCVDDPKSARRFAYADPQVIRELGASDAIEATKFEEYESRGVSVRQQPQARSLRTKAHEVLRARSYLRESPGRGLARQLLDEFHDRGHHARASAPFLGAIRVRPLARDDTPMPAQNRLRRDDAGEPIEEIAAMRFSEETESANLQWPIMNFLPKIGDVPCIIPAWNARTSPFSIGSRTNANS